MIVYLAQDIPAFVMCCVNGESGSSLLIESIDSMIQSLSVVCVCVRACTHLYVYKRDLLLSRMCLLPPVFLPPSLPDMRRDVQEVFKMTPHEKQVMMFSATLPKEIRPIAKKFMNNV